MPAEELPENKRKRNEDDEGRPTHSKLCRLQTFVSKDSEARTALRIVTDTASLQQMHSKALAEEQQREPNTDSDLDSLFDDTSSLSSSVDVIDTSTNATSAPTTQVSSISDTPANNVSTISVSPASRSAPSIPGLYFDPDLRLPAELAEEVMWTCIRTYFQSSSADQIMLFERASTSPSSNSGLPPVLTSLLSTLSTLLAPLLPPEKHALLFPEHSTPFARQAILNLYWPGDGITPHVDLLDRYGDGIIGVSFGSGCVMQFAKVRKGRGDEPASERLDDGVYGDGERFGVYLPPGSVIVLTEEARYTWTHGIEKHLEDLVQAEDQDAVWLPRDVRLSVTFRWLLPGADVVGETKPGPVTDLHGHA